MRGKRKLAAVFACLFLALVAATGVQLFAFANEVYQGNFAGYSGGLSGD